MLDVKSNNPALRSTTAALTAFSAVTLVYAAAIGFSKPEGDGNPHKWGVYGALLAAGCGAVFGLVTKDKPKTAESLSANKVENKDWKDWRNFVVERKVKESAEITSFYLKPQDNGEIINFKPGQFLTIKLDIPERERPVIRTYSLSDSTKSGYYRLSIKREKAPQDLDVPPGVASNFMHDRVEEGTIIPAKPPNGKFFLDLNKSIPVVLVSNGVGITPMISMAKAVSRYQSDRHVWFLHGARNGEYHAFREEIMAIAENNPHLHVHYAYSRPRAEDEGKYHTQGYVDTELIKTAVIPAIEKHYGSTDAEYFLCGSPAFLDSTIAGLKEAGVAEERIFFESFSKGKGGKVAEEKTSVGEVDSAEVVFADSDKTLTWKSGDGTILEFAEANGLNPPYSCRQGICLTCMCAIAEGEVEYTEEPTGTPDEGSVLICISQPKTKKVVLEL